MARILTSDDVTPAMLGGLLLSAGGSGMARSLERHDLAAEVGLGYGQVRFVTLDELPDDGWLLISTSVGAPGFAQPELVLRDHVEAARKLIERVGSQPCGVICGHVPGFNGWLVAAALNLPYVDAAANGRGHPTVKMGGMGLQSEPTAHLFQVALAGYDASGSRLEVVAEGNLSKTAAVMRHAATISGGLVASARGPVSVRRVAEFSAAGAIDFQLALGRAMMNAAPGPDRIKAAADAMGGEVLMTGRVARMDVTYANGFDAGHMVVTDGTRELSLGVYNEFMSADLDGRRVATFPDMLGSLHPRTGNPIAIAQLSEGDDVAIVSGDHRAMPVGTGALDPTVFSEVEAALGLDLFSYCKTEVTPR